MRVGIEGLSFHKNPGGIGKYFISLIESLIDSYPSYTFYCYSNKDINIPERLKDKIVLQKDKGLFSKLKSNVWLKFFAWRSIKSDHLDFYISSAGFFPILSKRIKRVVLVHDLNYKIVPKTMGWFHWVSYYLFFKKDVQRADFILTNSKGTSDKIFRFLGVKSHAIINPPCSSLYKPQSKNEIEITLEKYNIAFPYFLTVGTLEPRKNLNLTIDVFLSLLRRYKKHNHKLVIVGGDGWKNSKILALCDSHKRDIIRLGFVPEEDLPGLYGGASAFLFPSIYEGFGMPVREAVNCACPVITSDLVELREASYGAAIFINPSKEDDFLRAMEVFLSRKIENTEVKKNNNHSEMSTFMDFFKTIK